MSVSTGRHLVVTSSDVLLGDQACRTILDDRHVNGSSMLQMSRSICQLLVSRTSPLPGASGGDKAVHVKSPNGDAVGTRWSDVDEQKYAAMLCGISWASPVPAARSRATLTEPTTTIATEQDPDMLLSAIFWIPLPIVLQPILLSVVARLQPCLVITTRVLWADIARRSMSANATCQAAVILALLSSCPSTPRHLKRKRGTTLAGSLSTQRTMQTQHIRMAGPLSLGPEIVRCHPAAHLSAMLAGRHHPSASDDASVPPLPSILDNLNSHDEMYGSSLRLARPAPTSSPPGTSSPKLALQKRNKLVKPTTRDFVSLLPARREQREVTMIHLGTAQDARGMKPELDAKTPDRIYIANMKEAGGPSRGERDNTNITMHKSSEHDLPERILAEIQCNPSRPIVIRPAAKSTSSMAVLRAVGGDFVKSARRKLCEPWDWVSEPVQVHDVEASDIYQCSQAELRAHFEPLDPSLPRPIWNLLALDFAGTSFESGFTIPDFVTKLSWESRYGGLCSRRDDQGRGVLDGLRFVVFSDEGSVTGPHIDYTGTTVCLIMIKGRKTFRIARPTSSGCLQIRHSIRPGQIPTFEETPCSVHLDRGDVMILPGGSPHAVTTHETSVMVAVNFLHDYAIRHQIAAYQMETDLSDSAGCSHFPFLAWHAALDLHRRVLHELERVTVEVALITPSPSSKAPPTPLSTTKTGVLPLPPPDDILFLFNFVANHAFEINEQLQDSLSVGDILKRCRMMQRDGATYVTSRTNDE